MHITSNMFVYFMEICIFKLFTTKAQMQFCQVYISQTAFCNMRIALIYLCPKY